MSRIGYARVSTRDQYPEAQEQRLTDAGCDKVFTDHGASGSKASRPEWDACVAFLRPGDALVCTKLDRVGRSVKNLIEVADELQRREVDLVCLDQAINTTTAEGKLFFQILAAFAEFERNMIVERTRDGLAATPNRGRKGGRPARLTPELVERARKLRADGHSIREIGEMVGNGKPASRQTIYRALGMMGR
jgi:DNA invertase Pin-like site-specific DNA recombinase